MKFDISFAESDVNYDDRLMTSRAGETGGAPGRKADGSTGAGGPGAFLLEMPRPMVQNRSLVKSSDAVSPRIYGFSST
jgi:hypothetical protein